MTPSHLTSRLEMVFDWGFSKNVFSPTGLSLK